MEDEDRLYCVAQMLRDPCLASCDCLEHPQQEPALADESSEAALSLALEGSLWHDVSVPDRTLIHLWLPMIRRRLHQPFQLSFRTVGQCHPEAGVASFVANCSH